MHDAQHGIERVGIDGLLDAPARGRRIPLRAKIAALHEPAPGIPRHADVLVAGFGARRRQFDFKIEAGAVRRTHVAAIAILNLAHERGIVATQPYGKAADLDDHAGARAPPLRSALVSPVKKVPAKGG